MARRTTRRTGLSVALQSALGALAGAAGGYATQKETARKVAAEEAAKRRLDLQDMFTYGDYIVSPEPLATRAPAGEAPTMEAKAPPSVIPMPSERVDMSPAMQALERAEQNPPGTMMMEIGGRQVPVAIGARRREIEAGRAREAARTTARTQAEITSELEQEDFARKLPAIQDAMAKIPKDLLSDYERNLVLSGIVPITSALQLVGQRRQAQAEAAGGAAARRTADMRAIRSNMVSYIAKVRGMTKRIQNPDPALRYGPQAMIEVPLSATEQQELIDQYRSDVFREYGFDPLAGEVQRQGGRGNDLNLDGGAPASRGRQSNVSQILDRMTAFGERGAPTPMEYTFSSGRKYTLPF